MIVATLIFICGRPLYISKQPEGNMIVDVSKCIWTALRTKSRVSKDQKRNHWLDYAEKKCGPQLVKDVKALLNVLVLYTPVPIFWALFDQQGSRWTFQATQMDGSISHYYSIKADQMQVINPLLILVFIPLFASVLYPVLSKIGIGTPLRKLAAGGFLCAIAFMISAIVEFQLEKVAPVLPSATHGQLRIFPVPDCNFQVTTDIPDYKLFNLTGSGMFEAKKVVPGNYKLDFSTRDEACSKYALLAANIDIQAKKTFSFVLTEEKGKLELKKFEDSSAKSRMGESIVRVFTNAPNTTEILLQNQDTHDNVMLNGSTSKQVSPGRYDLWANQQSVLALDLKPGSSVRIVLRENSGSWRRNENKSTFEGVEHQITQPNRIHMLWQLPQYIVMTAAEVMFSVTGLEFSFTQAPESMKSVLSAMWLLVSILICICIAKHFFCFGALISGF